MTGRSCTRSIRGGARPHSSPIVGSVSTSAPTSPCRTRSHARSSTPVCRTCRSSSVPRPATTSTPHRSRTGPSSAASRSRVYRPTAIRELAHAYATADAAQLCWTLGITEHHNGVDNVLSLCNLAILTGQVGRFGAGLTPLRGQNNVQGGGDMGALPNKLPGFQDVDRRCRPRQVRGRVGRDGPRRERLAPDRDVRGHGTRRTPVAVRDR